MVWFYQEVSGDATHKRRGSCSYETKQPGLFFCTSTQVLVGVCLFWYSSRRMFLFFIGGWVNLPHYNTFTLNPFYKVHPEGGQLVYFLEPAPASLIYIVQHTWPGILTNPRVSYLNPLCIPSIMRPIIRPTRHFMRSTCFNVFVIAFTHILYLGYAGAIGPSSQYKGLKWCLFSLGGFIVAQSNPHSPGRTECMELESQVLYSTTKRVRV